MKRIDTLPDAGSPELVRLPKRKRAPLLDLALPAIAIGSGVMLFLSVPNIIGGSGAWAYAKAATLALSATAVAFGINKLAIERGAPLATIGYIGAGLTSLISIAMVGAGLYAATYSGLTLKDVAELQLQEHGTRLSRYVSSASSATSAEAARVNPAIRSIEADLAQKAACEVAGSCISGRSVGGLGTVARAVGEYAGRAASIGQQIAASDALRQETGARLDGLIADYLATLGKNDVDILDRRVQLQTIDGRIREAVGALDEAVPLALLAAYARELQTGVSLPDRPEAEARLNGILSRHGASLASVLETIDDARPSPPDFPRRTGVSDTFGYISHFLPIAAVAGLVELIFPLVLWGYTFWDLSWRKFQLDPPPWAREAAARSEALPIPPPPNEPASDRRPYPGSGGNGHDPRRIAP